MVWIRIYRRPPPRPPLNAAPPPRLRLEAPRRLKSRSFAPQCAPAKALLEKEEPLAEGPDRIGAAPGDGLGRVAPGEATGRLDAGAPVEGLAAAPPVEAL
ncbi:MAG TPA: hypothetical protein P5525_06245, partial [Candidatus Paceibacterota bacterium]|nr:hypothetical protein [Candidatus Paceibacterota bacterium]